MLQKPLYRILFSCILLTPLYSGAQQDFKKNIAYLCSEDLAGRGYVDKGLEKAADFISGEFEKAGLKKIGGSWFQNFKMSVNTFPGSMEIVLGNNVLKPGYDYLVKASSASLQGIFPLHHVHLADLENDSAYLLLLQLNLSRTIVVLDTMSFTDELINQRYQKILHNRLKSQGIIVKSIRRLIWTVAQNQAAFFTMECLPGVIQDSDSLISINVEAKYIKRYKAKNIIGMVPGTRSPDSFLVISAHYDHLGKMGSSTFFPGANDNASGTAMLLDLAYYYGKNPQPFSLIFIAFTAEEAGLLGSKYFVENPLFSLNGIRFLINLDLEGTGKDGITAVNASVFESDFNSLLAVNDSGHYLSVIAPRGKAANSDHYWFSEKGVPCFFIYQMGEYGHYHDPGDRAELLPLDAFVETQNLVIQFFNLLQSSSH